MTLLSRLAEAKTVQTPAATMRTLVSPSAGPDLPFATWWTELPELTAGPVHVVDGDQLLIVTQGAVEVQLDDEAVTLGPGDALKLPGGRSRVIRANSGPAQTLTIGQPNALATLGAGEPVLVPWTA